MRIALVSREVYPLGGGGIGQFVAAAARLLAGEADVTVFTTSLAEPAYRLLRDAGDARLPPPSVRFVFVPEPAREEALGWSHAIHCYGTRVLASLKAAYGERGPDLIEFPDYLGEGFVTLQAARALDPFLDGTSLCVRLHTTEELCQVLNGFLDPHPGVRALHAIERFSLAHADHVIWQGGDILGAYARYYGDGALAPATRIRYPYAEPLVAEGIDSAHQVGTPLRILYAGRLERRKGIHNLIRAVTGLKRQDFQLTLMGGDTPTAPLAMSMRQYLELAIADDPRIELRDAQDRAALAQTIRAHDVVVVPSLWECWPYAALEALHLNRPVLGTPVGGLAEMLAEGQSGWLCAGSGPIELEDGIERLLDSGEEVQRLIREHRPLRRARELCEPRGIREGYRALAGHPRHVPPPRPGPPPLVTAIVPYYRAAAFVRDTVESLQAQSYPRLEVVIVNDGSFEPEDWVLAELSATRPLRVVTQMNQGLGAARNFGIAHARGRYVFPLDADNIAEPEFVARAVEILERRPEVAYVTSWSRYIQPDGSPLGSMDHGYQPLGNHATELSAHDNVAGDAAAVLRRGLFDAGFRYSEELTSYEDWHLYRELAAAGRQGAIIPERLIRYRVRADSMQAEIARPRRQRLLGEIEARLRENGTRWTSSNA